MTIPFLCTPGQEQLFPWQEIHPLTSRQALQQFFKQHPDPLSGILLQAELRWDNFYYSDFAGLEQVRELRVQWDRREPVLITSYFPDLPGEDISTLYRAQHFFKDPALVFSPLTDLMQLDIPAIVELLPDPLEDPDLVEDLKMMIYDQQGYLSEFFHDLYYKINRLPAPLQPDKLCELLRREFRKLRAIFPAAAAKIDQQLYNLTGELKEKSSLRSGEVYQLLERYQRKIKALLPAGQSSLQPYRPPRPTHLLYIDDEERAVSRLRKKFEAFSVHVHSAKGSEEAIDLLRQHPQIRVVLCDYRFYDDSGRWAREQGYHILRRIRREPVPYQLIALTQMDDAFLPHFLEKEKVVAFSKREVLDTDRGFGLLFQMVVESKNRLEEKINPPFDGLLKKYYEVHRHHHGDFEQAEQEIADYALRYVQAVKERTELAAFPPLDNLQASLETKDRDHNLSCFRNKLKARRIALGLCQLAPQYLGDYKNRQEMWSAIFSLLKINTIQMDCQKRYHGNFYTFFKTDLNLSVKEQYPHQAAASLPLTREERHWLQDFGPLLKKKTGIRRTPPNRTG